jgi:hypothetical protein
MSMSDSMKKTYRLPLLPGNTCGEDLLRRNYRKPQLLTSDPQGIKSVADAPDQVPADFSGLKVSPTGVVRSAGSGSKGRTVLPPLDSLTRTTASQVGLNALRAPDAKVLRFYAYYPEAVTEHAKETWRVRRVVITYHLDDNTLSVSEPRQDNAGIPQQGLILKRHQVEASKGRLITWDQFAVGGTVTFYGRSYTIVDADGYTRSFMDEQGMPQGAPASYPDDAFELSRLAPGAGKRAVESVVSRTNAAGMKVKLSQEEVRATQQFLANDRKVLRCDVVWDDRDALYGEVRFFTLYYFLSDNTIELVEKEQTNAGRDPFPSFVRRQRMLKPREQGGPANIGATVAAGNPLLAKGNGGIDLRTIYTDQDLRIGSSVTVFGRPMLITNYDAYTREHMESNFGITDHSPIVMEVPQAQKRERVPPPYNGFGTEADSLSSWRSLDLKAPRKDLTGARQFGGDAVKFALRLNSANPNDEMRKFILTYFLADSTVAIFEPPQRNSGMVGGKFLQRCPAKNAATGAAFVPSDFFLGAEININGFNFTVIDTDKHTLGVMEQYATSFPRSNISAVVNRFTALLTSDSTGLYQAMSAAARSGVAPSVAGFLGMLHQLELAASEQEVVTLLRFFEKSGESQLSYAELAERVLQGAEPASDPRTWQEIEAALAASALSESAYQQRPLAPVSDVDPTTESTQATTAAYAARAFLEAYEQRRVLFRQEFKFVTDMSGDSRIGDAEFRRVVAEKLKLPLSGAQVDALCIKAFPPGQRRKTFEEFLRLLENTSHIGHNFEDIKARGQRVGARRV